MLWGYGTVAAPGAWVESSLPHASSQGKTNATAMCQISSSCGALVHDQRLILPSRLANSAIAFALAGLAGLLVPLTAPDR